MTHKEQHYDMITATGNQINYLNAVPEAISYEDMRIHMSRICRYNGAVDWKLLQHLVLCLYLAKTSYDDPAVALYALVHDVQEYIVGDMVTGLKNHCKEFRTIEDHWEHAVLRALGLNANDSTALHAFVKQIDTRALVLEMTMLGHPAATQVQKQFGGPPDESEIYIFNYVHDLTPGECWNIFLSNLHILREELYGSKESNWQSSY